VVDVRQHNEFQAGHVQGALNIELGELTEHLDGLPREMPLAVLCASGMRATIAGSILQRDGRKNIQVLAESGTPEWLAKGYPSATGDAWV
jgi:rhodanese-related sulfurtransferase